MSNIKALDEKTIQLIAAGEVIERPSSIVKELIENSFDAGATKIKIEEEEGGKSIIRISDDGCGMSEEDISLAFLPHYTSKLNNIDDLYNIASYGFRGEALSSISAVSKIDVITKRECDNLGIKAEISEHRVISKEPYATNSGTVITIKDLFYNAPIRKKFLKTDRAESASISDVVMRAALSKREVDMEYYRNGTKVFSSLGTQSLKERIYILQGREMENHLKYFNINESDINIEGAISDNSLYRGNKSSQYLFINNRPVFVPGISKAIENQYRSLIPHSKFPVFFLYLNIPPNEVDVNVHPNKKEVRLVNQDFIIDLLIKSVKKTLYDNPAIRNINHKNETEKNEIILIEEKERKPEDFFTKVIGIREKSLYYTDNDNSTLNVSENSDNYNDILELHDGDDYSEEKIEINEKLTEPKEVENLLKTENIFENLRLIGTLFNSYILMEDTLNQSLVIIDQHAAHERILYEKFRKKYRNLSISSQMLLQAETITLSDNDKTVLLSNLDKLKEFGFELEDFGGREVLIRGVPELFDFPTSRDLLLQIIATLDETETLSEFKLEKIMKNACVNAIKFGDKLNNMEIEDLLTQLSECEYFETCPHGRPTMIKVSKNYFSKVFLRS